MTNWSRLREVLTRLNGQGYKAYKSLQGEYAFPDFRLKIAHVQGDPFAAPSRVSLVIAHGVANFPEVWRATPTRRVALADYLHRQVQQVAQEIHHKRGSGKGGLISVLSTSQAILGRTAVQIHPQTIELRLGVGLPAFGRRIAGDEAIALLGEDLPRLVDRGLRYGALSHQAIEQHIHTAEDADAMRQHLMEQGLVAFIANGAVLPRRSGVDERPLAGVPFQAPADLQVTLTTPHAGPVAGLGIPQGITLLVGGGYHGKSTVLRAIEQGIYTHIPGDGREQVVTHPDAVKIRAEDRRSVVGVDISPFINDLPQGLSTQCFSTTNASGSTSQAASIVEAIEAGAKLLLIDEDTAATNFMIRDRTMQALIAKAKEPITPFIDKVRQLYTDHGVSTILVMGGSGDYFSVADTVIALDTYQPKHVTQQAQAIARANPSYRQPEGGDAFGTITHRHIQFPEFERDPGRRYRPPKVKIWETHKLSINREDLDLRAIEQLIEPGQLRAVAQAILYCQEQQLDRQLPLTKLLDQVMEQVDRHGLDSLTPYPMSDLVSFRRHELAAAINRLRSLTARA
jgi:predicted ABC-class ATPase